MKIWKTKQSEVYNKNIIKETMREKIEIERLLKIQENKKRESKCFILLFSSLLINKDDPSWNMFQRQGGF